VQRLKIIKKGKFSRRGFITVVGGGIVLAAGAATFLSLRNGIPKEALEAWDGPDAGEDLRRKLVSYAILSPSPHNLQSWRVQFFGTNGIRLFVDPTRLIPEVDQEARQIMVAQGCFLETLVVAAGHLGYAADVSLFPDGPVREDLAKRPVAEILLTKATIPADPLFDQILHRKTSRAPFDQKHLVSQTELNQLTAVRVPTSIEVAGTINAEEVRQLTALAISSNEVECDTARTRNETVDHIHIGASEIAKNREGISIAGTGVWWASHLGLLSNAAMRDPSTKSFASLKTMVEDAAKSSHAYLWIKSRTNSPEDQIAAGRAWVRLTLQATRQGLMAHPLSQALEEFDEMTPQHVKMRQLTECKDKETIQMFARLGYGAGGEHSPRRRLASFITSA
jgi:nitroreductase